MTIGEAWAKHMAAMIAEFRRRDRGLRDKYGRWTDEDMAPQPTDPIGANPTTDPRSDPRQP